MSSEAREREHGTVRAQGSSLGVEAALFLHCRMVKWMVADCEMAVEFNIFLLCSLSQQCNRDVIRPGLPSLLWVVPLGFELLCSEQRRVSFLCRSSMAY